MRRYRLWLAAAALTLCLGGCGKAEEEKAPETEPVQTETKAQEQQKETQEDEQPDLTSGPEAHEQALAICGRYFKGGDARYDLLLNFFQPGRLFASLSKYEGFRQEDPYLYSFIENSDVIPESGVSRYPLENGEMELRADGTVEIIHENEDVSGIYYPYDSLFMAETFERPLNEADLIGYSQDEIRLMLNEIYAVYGRQFKNEELNEYFQSQPWYEGRIEADAFDESVMTGVALRNIRFLKEARENYDKKTAESMAKEASRLPEAPYLEFLSADSEVSISIDPTESRAEDCGVYFSAKGQISLPLTVNQEELMRAEAGETLLLQEDPKSGEMIHFEAVDEKTEQENGFPFIIYTPSDKNSETPCQVSYDQYLDEYRVWTNSDDTICLPVYEGPIYVLKGAQEEWYGSFELIPEENTEDFSQLRVMNFDEPDTDEPRYYGGNKPAFNEKGYLTGLYYFGD